MRAPGTYRGLAREVENMVGEEIYKAAGTYTQDHPDDRAEAVMELLEEGAVVIFDGGSVDADERSFVVGDSRRAIEAVLIPTRPTPPSEEPAQEIIVATDGDAAAAVAGGSGWSVRRASLAQAEAIYQLTTPEENPAEQRIGTLEEENRELKADLHDRDETIEELQAEVGDLREEVASLTQENEDLQE